MGLPSRGRVFGRRPGRPFVRIAGATLGAWIAACGSAPPSAAEHLLEDPGIDMPTLCTAGGCEPERHPLLAPLGERARLKGDADLVKGLKDAAGLSPGAGTPEALTLRIRALMALSPQGISPDPCAPLPAAPPGPAPVWPRGRGRHTLTLPGPGGPLTVHVQRPDDAPPSALALLLPGHGDLGSALLKGPLGQALGDAGYLVVGVDLPDHGCDLAENRAALQLRGGGLTLMGVKLAQVQGVIDAALGSEAQAGLSPRIAVYGHSGGASVARLLSLVDPRVAGTAVDMSPRVLNLCGPMGVHCETLPELLPFEGLIARHTAPWNRRMEIDYGRLGEAEIAGIVAFFGAALSAGGEGGAPQGQPTP